MGNKTFVILLLVALSVVVVLQNTGKCALSFFWINITIAKSTIILSALATGLVMGVMIAGTKTPNKDNKPNKNNEDENYLN